MAMSNISGIIDKMFDEFKKTVLEEIQKEMEALVKKEKQQVTDFITTEKTTLMRECGDLAVKQHQLQVENAALREENNKLGAKIHDLEQVGNAALRQENNKLDSKIHDLEQYYRRPNSRVYNPPVEDKEKIKPVEAKVDRTLTVMSVSDQSEFRKVIKYDRAHRMGKVKVNGNAHKSQSVIVRSKSFHDRTVVYKARKSEIHRKFIGNQVEYDVSLDLTKRKLKLELLNTARDGVKNVEGIKAANSDIDFKVRDREEKDKQQDAVSVEAIDDTKDFDKRKEKGKFKENDYKSHDKTKRKRKKRKDLEKPGSQLYQFILLLLESKNASITWVDQKKHIFRILDTEKVATLWGESRKRPMTYDSLSRALRYYYKQEMLIPVNKKLHYQFTKKSLDEFEEIKNR